MDSLSDFMLIPDGNDAPLLRVDLTTNSEGFKTTLFVQKLKYGRQPAELLIILSDERFEDGSGQSVPHCSLSAQMAQVLRAYLDEHFPEDASAEAVS